jgi:hypothetical protein
MGQSGFYLMLICRALGLEHDAGRCTAARFLFEGDRSVVYCDELPPRKRGESS